jgi:hypothetical protein
MKKTLLLPSLFVLILAGFIFSTNVPVANACYPVCEMNVCVNGSCPQYPAAYHGDTISLSHVSGLADATKVTLDKISIPLWEIEMDSWVKFVVPENIPASPNGTNTSVRVYKGDILVGSDTVWIYSGSRCNEDVWQCENWGMCTILGIKTRGCTKTFDCPSVPSASPSTSQSCAYIPSCSSDSWSCGNWTTCSEDGIQNRTCIKTSDCPLVENSSPATVQICTYTAPYTPRVPAKQSPITAPFGINQSQVVKATVKLDCPDGTGSGTIISSDGTILTNAHVVDGGPGFCRVGFVDNFLKQPLYSEIAYTVKISKEIDAAIMKIQNPNRSFDFITVEKLDEKNIDPGEEIKIYGYPGIGGETMTVTQGSFSGLDGEYIKTDGRISAGNSGGGAYFARNGGFVGIPSRTVWRVGREDDKINQILYANAIIRWMNTGVFAVVQKRVVDMAQNFNWTKSKTTKKEVIPSTGDQSRRTDTLSRRLKGTIVLQVESHGEAYYINPDNEKRYALGRPADAFQVMRELGLGVTHAFVTQYQGKAFPDHVVGKILLDVGDFGKAYYIYPKNKRAYYLGRPADAYRMMRELGLGISNRDLENIAVH